jgi:hypothetical protein
LLNNDLSRGIAWSILLLLKTSIVLFLDTENSYTVFGFGLKSVFMLPILVLAQLMVCPGGLMFYE